MRHLSSIIIILCCSSAWAFPPGFVAAVTGSQLSSASVPADIVWDFESSADCSTLFPNVYPVVDCANTINPGGSGSVSAKLSGGSTSGFIYVFPSTKDDVWGEAVVYRDSSSPSIGYLINIEDTTGADIAYVFQATTRLWSMRDVTGAITYTGSNAGRGQQYDYFRFYVHRSNTEGVLKLWSSTDGINWVLQVNQTTLDTDKGYAYNRITIGRNNGSNLPEDWYFPTVSLWYSNPGW